MAAINLVFHDITSNAPTDDEYSLTIDAYSAIVRGVHSAFAGVSEMRIRVYLDDGLLSAWRLVPDAGLYRTCEHVIALSTSQINRPGHLTEDQIIGLSKLGFRIASHGVSHSALAIFRDNILLGTPAGGSYKEGPGGKHRQLRTETVRYELVESRKLLSELVRYEIEEFVLPYGLYNEQTILLNQNWSGYRFLATCDGGIDFGGEFRHRIVVTRESTVTELLTAPIHPNALRDRIIN